MGSYEDAFEEHESCRVVDNRPDLYNDQSMYPMGDIQDDESPMMS